MNPLSPVGELADVITHIPYRMALAGGWIDQPFISCQNPSSMGSMVVVSLEPNVRYMDRCGMATSTRNVAFKRWGPVLPNRSPAALVRELYAAENKGRTEPSGSQDMIGLIYPGINRLDYAADQKGGYFPAHIEPCQDPEVARWVEQRIYLLPVNQRPVGYNPLGVKNIEPTWVHKLGQSGRNCYDAIVARDLRKLGASMNECMACWEVLLPHTVQHSSITHDLCALLGWYQARYPGAMFSGCGGGYLLVVSEEPVPGGAHVKIRMA